MKGIPFMPEMAVAALRDVNPKTETRRLINPQPFNAATKLEHFRERSWQATMPDPEIADLTLLLGHHVCEYVTGERRCMLATWAVDREWDRLKPIGISAAVIENHPLHDELRFWHTGLGIPKPDWAGISRPSRFLPNHLRHLMPVFEIGDIRAERLNDISEADAKAEGIQKALPSAKCSWVYRDYSQANYDPFEWFSSPVSSYRTLWEKINGAGSWALNPWVFVIQFRRVTP